MPKELDPVVLNLNNSDNLWRNVATKICDDPDGVVPVYVVNQEHRKDGEFKASIVTEGNKAYFQLEDFDSPELAESFMSTSTADWEEHPGGIYRLDISFIMQSPLDKLTPEHYVTYLDILK